MNTDSLLSPGSSADLLAVAVTAARAAAAIQRAGAERRASLGVRYKGAVDLVTEVDVASEEAIRAVFAERAPGIPILGEEGGGAVGAPTRWVVDPLDGTTNFVHGFPLWSVSIGLEVDGRSELGVVLEVVRDRVFSARRGHGAHVDGRRLAVSAEAELGHALVGTGFPYDRRENAAFYAGYVEAALRRVSCLRRTGSAALDHAFLAEGVLDAYWEFNLAPWDCAAGRLLVTEAGGRVSAHDGSDLPFDGKLHPLATNGLLHAEMVALLGAQRRAGE